MMWGQLGGRPVIQLSGSGRAEYLTEKIHIDQRDEILRELLAAYEGALIYDDRFD